MSGKNEVSDGLVEEGEAFRRLVRLDARRPAAGPERFDVVVIGAGQAGLSVGYHLARRGLRFVILDAEARVGDVWRKRWDSLRLFTPARLDGLDGMKFPARPGYFPTKDEMADYLEAYATRFELPVRTGVRVDRVSRRDGRYLVRAGALELEADQVVIAMATFQRPQLPRYAAQLGPGVTQLHSSAYRNPGQLRDGDVLVVGAGNSGAEIAMDLARARRADGAAAPRIFLSGRHPGQAPFDINKPLTSRVLMPLVLRVVFHRLLTIKTPMGRKARPKVLSKGGPLIRTKLADLEAAGVERVPRIAGARDGKPLLDDGRALDVRNVVWCNGFEPGFSWIDRPVFGGGGELLHDGGVARGEPGLYFVGLHFLYAMSSTMIHGVGRDAARIAKAVAARKHRCLARAGEIAAVTEPAPESRAALP